MPSLMLAFKATVSFAAVLSVVTPPKKKNLGGSESAPENYLKFSESLVVDKMIIFQ